jgi:TolA-binding protein
MLFKLERYKELEQLRRRVLEIYQNWLGPRDSSTLDAMNMLGASLHMQKRYDEADVYFQKYLKG